MRAFLEGQAFAHRGFWGGETPENSLAAFRRARELGFGAECDVHLSSDKVPMVFHDFDLKRMCDQPASIGDCPADVLTQTRFIGSDETIPALAALLDETDDRPVLIELKTDESENYIELGRKVADLVRQYTAPLALMSFDYRIVRMCKSLHPGMKVGFLPDEGFSASAKDIQRVRSRSIYVAADFLAVNIGDLSAGSELSEELGLPLACWTIRNEKDLLACIDHKAAPIFENLPPDLVRNALST